LAFSAATAWEVRTTGSDSLNSGGFVAGASGTDYSQQNAAQYSGTDLASTSGTTNPSVVTSATHSFVAADVGNILRVTAGTSWTAGFYQIVSVAGGAATLDRAVGTAATLSAGSYAVGGAFASPGQAAAVRVANNPVYIKSGTYTLSATANVSGGRVNDTLGGVSTAPGVWEGYETTRGDGCPTNNRPVLLAGAASISCLTVTGSHGHVRHLEFGGNGQAGCGGINHSGDFGQIRNCKVNAFPNGGVFTSGAQCKIIGCEGVACSAATTFQSQGSANYAGCSVRGMTSGTAAFYANATAGVTFWRCLASGNACAGFLGGGGGGRMVGAECTSRGNTGASGWGFDVAAGGHFFGCLAYGNAAGSFRGSASGSLSEWLFNCAYDTAPANLAAAANVGGISLTADPFRDAAGNDFSPNGAAGGGALLRHAGWPSSWPGLSTPSYPDVGASQGVSGVSRSRAVNAGGV
jgi:hypothetical protein